MKHWMLLAILCGGVSVLHGQSTAFTYQGRLTANGSLANGSHDLRFTLFAVESGGDPASGPLAVPSVGVTNGIFTVALDFGADAFTGIGHWLAIAVRPAGSTNFTTLNPRQPITPTPKALTALTAFTALSVPGVSGNALHAADGSPDNAVFVDTAGRVGIGTTSPQERFDLRSGDGSFLRVDNVNGDMRVNGGSDGHWGIFNEGASSGGTHLIGEGQSRFFVGNSGNVGIGTTTPQARLDVRGDVRLGSAGQLLATGGQERLRILRGGVNSDGTPNTGFGFTCTRTSTGVYHIEFIPWFSNLSIPVMTANAAAAGNDSTPIVAIIGNPSSRNVDIILRRGSDGGLVNRGFNFVVIGEAE